MKPGMSAHPLFEMITFDHLAPHPDGVGMVAVDADGSVISVQVNGTLERRPMAKAAQWERFIPVLDDKGNTVALAAFPSGQPDSKPFMFGYTPNVPNT